MNTEYNRKLKIKNMERRIKTLHTILGKLEGELQILEREQSERSVK